MDPFLLRKLNTERAARRAVIHLTDLGDGRDRVIREGDPVAGPLGDALASAFRLGKSGLVEAEERSFFLNVHLPPARIVIIGAVHISQALVPLARLLGYEPVVVDPRTAFASPDRFPEVRLIAEWPDVALPPLGVDRYTAFVALTHDPKIDDPALQHALARDCFYVGALGSRKTHGRRLERLTEAGFDATATGRIHAPIGLDIGAVSPAEIALAILAEIVQTLRGPRRKPA